jgi:2-polyprenyl-6-methoxyphenol hydroxylase-like FAD-dependent oxidoreductase
MFDVIVVGARCAGASLAMLLARGGHRVAVVDRASFPSDTMSTHFLRQRAAFRLRAGDCSIGCTPAAEHRSSRSPSTSARCTPLRVRTRRTTGATACAAFRVVVTLAG